jgi:hypothetical protein
MTISASRGGSFLRFRTGTTGLSGRHVAYITRERAVIDREKAILVYQLPEHVRGAVDYKGLRQTLIAYADTQTHVHVWIDARQIDGKKIQLARQQHRSLDVSWNHIYSRETGIDPHEHERKQEETRAEECTRISSQLERRELGAQASREWAERPGCTFLERVREAAGADLRQAKSWAELDQRRPRKRRAGRTQQRHSGRPPDQEDAVAGNRR